MYTRNPSTRDRLFTPEALRTLFLFASVPLQVVFVLNSPIVNFFAQILEQLLLQGGAVYV